MLMFTLKRVLQLSQVNTTVVSVPATFVDVRWWKLTSRPACTLACKSTAPTLK